MWALRRTTCISDKANNKSDVLCFAKEKNLKLLDFSALSGLPYYEGMSHNEETRGWKEAECHSDTPDPTLLAQKSPDSFRSYSGLNWWIVISDEMQIVVIGLDSGACESQLCQLLGVWLWQVTWDPGLFPHLKYANNGDNTVFRVVVTRIKQANTKGLEQVSSRGWTIYKC